MEIHSLIRKSTFFKCPWVAHEAPLSVGFSLIRILEWVTISSSRGPSPSRIEPALQADRFFTSEPLWTSHKDLHFCIYPLGGSSSPYRRKETRGKVRAICALQCVSHFSWPGRKTCFLLGLNSHKESSLTWIRYKLNHLSNLEPLSQKVKTTVSQLLRWVSTSFMDLPFVVSLQQQQQQIPYLLNFLTSYSFSAVYHY